MQSQQSKTAHFAQHYRQLDLDDNADWDGLRSNYRRLVHLWHPDRFAQKPRERAHAQQNFIKLTKSYNVLRNFYREHHRLPFQAASAANTQHVASSNDDTQADRQSVDDTVTMDSSVFQREPSQHAKSIRRSSTFKKVAWSMTGACIMLGTIMFFLILDRNAHRAVAEQGREIVREAPASEFLPSAAEIRRSQSRGAFVKPTQ